MNDKLLGLLSEKITILKSTKDKGEENLKEIKTIQGIINKIKEEPFELYNLEDEAMLYVVESLSLGQDYLEKLEKYKIIYDGYLQFGRSAIPQIALVEKFIEETKLRLNERRCSLSDDIVKNQYAILQYNEYNELLKEVSDPASYISRIDLLIQLLDESDLEEKEKNTIKLEVISKNNEIYQKESSNTKSVTVNEENDYEDKINAINERLEENFSQTTLNNLNSISSLLSSCQSREEVEKIIDEWKITFGDESFVKIVEALIDLKNIDLLTLKAIIGNDLAEYKNEADAIITQMDLLKEYKESLLKANELEDNSASVEIEDDMVENKLQQALNDYVEDPKATDNCVLFLSDGLDRDIRSIEDRETLEDVFLLIEQLRHNKVDLQHFSHNNLLKDLIRLKPNSRGRQARVVVAKLDSNIYGIIHVCGKKADNPKSLISTLDYRKKNCNIEQLKNNINVPQVLNYYVEKTKVISSKLKNMVSGSYEGKATMVTGGVK